MNGQIVLCKGVNDGEELERSIRDLSRYLPHLRSVSIVPVGLSKYRDGLYPLEPFTKEDAQNVLECVHRWQKMLYAEYMLCILFIAVTNGISWQSSPCRRKNSTMDICSWKMA